MKQFVLRVFFQIALVISVAIGAPAVMADDFGSVRFDPNGNQLVVTMIYDDTNPNHDVSIRWGKCRKLEGFDQPAQQLMDVWIFDSQGNDAARKRYEKTITVPLADLPCRPATLTLWTYPVVNEGGRTTIDIP